MKKIISCLVAICLSATVVVPAYAGVFQKVVKEIVEPVVDGILSGFGEYVSHAILGGGGSGGSQKDYIEEKITCYSRIETGKAGDMAIICTPCGNYAPGIGKGKTTCSRIIFINNSDTVGVFW